MLEIIKVFPLKVVPKQIGPQISVCEHLILQ